MVFHFFQCSTIWLKIVSKLVFIFWNTSYIVITPENKRPFQKILKILLFMATDMPNIFNEQFAFIWIVIMQPDKGTLTQHCNELNIKNIRNASSVLPYDLSLKLWQWKSHPSGHNYYPHPCNPFRICSAVWLELCAPLDITDMITLRDYTVTTVNIISTKWDDSKGFAKQPTFILLSKIPIHHKRLANLWVYLTKESDEMLNWISYYSVHTHYTCCCFNVS